MDTFKNIFLTMNTTQINIIETNLSNNKMCDFESTEEYVGMFNTLKDDIITLVGREKIDL